MTLTGTLTVFVNDGINLPTGDLSTNALKNEHKTYTTWTKYMDAINAGRMTIHLSSFYLQTLDFDRSGLTKMKKSVKALYSSGNSKFFYWPSPAVDNSSIKLPWLQHCPSTSTCSCKLQLTAPGLGASHELYQNLCGLMPLYTWYMYMCMMILSRAQFEINLFMLLLLLYSKFAVQ